MGVSKSTLAETRQSLAAASRGASVKTFADLVREWKLSKDGNLLPPKSGSRLPVTHRRAAGQRRSARRNVVDVDIADLQFDEVVTAHNPRSHGWKKQHKSSWNTLLRRKVEAQTQRRRAQSAA